MKTSPSRRLRGSARRDGSSSRWTFNNFRGARSVPRVPGMADYLLAIGFESFASPALLWGLALAAVPLIIHLLNKRKHREMNWAAMRFLLEAVRKNSRRLRIEQLILLAVRTLLLVL